MFVKRLNMLLITNQVSQTALAEYLGFKPQSISKWCRGETQPDQETTLKIAKYFNVSTDYLLGNDNKENNDEELREKEALRKALVNAGYMKDGEDLSDKELERLMKFVINNKDFIRNIPINEK